MSYVSTMILPPFLLCIAQLRRGFIIMQAFDRNVFGLEKIWLQAEVFLILLLILDIVRIIVVYRKNSREIETMLHERAARKERLQAEGIEAAATINKLEMGSRTVPTGVQRKLEVILELHVTPENSAPFQLQVSPMISELHIPQYQPGKQIRIRYVPRNPENCEVVDSVSDRMLIQPDIFGIHLRFILVCTTFVPPR